MTADKKEDQNASTIEVQSDAVIDFIDLFPTSFMQQYTDAPDIYLFFKNGGFRAETNEDFEQIDEKELDHYISAHTTFENWLEMLGVASNEYVMRQFGTDK